MSLLLKKTITSASKAGARRRLTAASSNDYSWRPSSSPMESAFWRSSSSSRDWRSWSCSLGTTARSLVTASWSEQGEDDRDGQRLRRASFTTSTHGIRSNPPPISRVSWSPTAVTSNRSLRTFATTTTAATARESWNHHSTTATMRRPPLVRYVHPPASIRSSLALHQLVAAERSASDLALRALTTWAFNNNHHSIAKSSNKSTRQAVSFFSTNKDGSRARDPNIARSGIRKTKIPTPPSGDPNPQTSLKPEDVINEINKKSKTVVLPAIMSGLKTVFVFLLNLPRNLFFYLTRPAEVKASWNNMKKVIKEEVDHYWIGTKLLWADLKTARTLLRRALRGSSLTRRERKQLLRTSSDLFRLIPFSMFLIIPLMEFALPFALKVFPNLLPSTFQDSLKAEENMKRELQTRIAMAKFFQETLEELAKEQKRSATHLKEEIKESGKEDSIDKSVVEQQEQSANSFLAFMEKARNGEMIPSDVIVQYAHFFKDDLTLDNMPRMQLINMCKYMGIPPYGSDSFLRFQLRHRMRTLREDDQRILWEGIDSLTKMELREACQERGMRSTGLSKDAYRRALLQWLDLSVKQNVPTSLLIMSRTFFLREEMFDREADDGSKSLAGLADTISGLDKEVVNEVILDVATSQEKLSDPGVRKIKLEVLMKQNEMIEQEQAEREEAAAKKKETAEKHKKEAEHEESDGSSQSPVPLESMPVIEVGLDSEEKDVSQTPDTTTTDSKMDEDLSADEMHAISQLVSADPVSRERADLESIKLALQDEKRVEQTEKRSQESDVVIEVGADGSTGPGLTDQADKIAALHIKESVDEALKSTSLSKEELGLLADTKDDELAEQETPPEDPVVARLKSRIESMVDKIEVQLSDVQVKIGDKLHVLDKDMDGILSVDEIAQALQQVLKRKITLEEAYEIAQQMDDNKDGVFTVQELIQWVETNLLVKFVEEGRDADADAVIEKQSAAEKEEPYSTGQQTDQTK